MSALERRLHQRLQQRDEQLRSRQRYASTARCQPHMQLAAGAQLCFASNDYLGLAGHPDLQAAAVAALAQYGTGAGASHLISGHHRAHAELEEALAEFTGRPRALLFGSGYAANMGTINALLGRGDLLLQDSLNHASLIDGGLLCRADSKRYRHADVDSAERQLESHQRAGAVTVLATDGVFSMDGDCAPLAQLAAVCQPRDVALMVDDAHGFGLLGESGGGLVEELGLSLEQVPILVGTLGKSFGSYGAFVAGSANLIEALVQFSRSYIYTTAQPPAIAAASLAALQLVRRDRWRRDHLKQLISYFRRAGEQLALPLMPSQTAIQPLLIGDEARLMAIDAQLRQRGLWVGAIRPPTVAEGSARLRITLTAAHSRSDVDQLLEALGELCSSSALAPR